MIQVSLNDSNPKNVSDYESIYMHPKRPKLFLKRNIFTYAWSTKDMTGIDPKIKAHELIVDPTFKPIKHKRQKLGPEYANSINDDLDDY